LKAPIIAVFLYYFFDWDVRLASPDRPTIDAQTFFHTDPNSRSRVLSRDHIASAGVGTMPDIDSFSVSQLRAYLKQSGADTAGCFEKVRGGPSERGEWGMDLTTQKNKKYIKVPFNAYQRTLGTR
jgi:hypothetical protein